jgi:hypothetical protein
MTLEVRRYEPALADDWHALLGRSRNGLFLFERPYMDYHSDRFADFSTIAYKDGAPAALLPASKAEDSDQVVSHAGLTFGGFVLPRETRTDAALECIDAMLDALRSWGARELIVKLVPSPFCSYPSQDVDYALWRRGFDLVRRDLSTVIPLAYPIAPNTSKRQAIAKASKAGLDVGAGSLDHFHALLADVLGWRHGVTPVHSLEELGLLASRFPDQIMLRTAELDGETLAGALVYRYPTAWHTQYLAASPEGRKCGALDLVIAGLIDEARAAGAQWFSFGTSTLDEGRSINEGLLWQKESFGGRAVTHDFMRGKL